MCRFTDEKAFDSQPRFSATILYRSARHEARAAAEEHYE